MRVCVVVCNDEHFTSCAHKEKYKDMRCVCLVHLGVYSSIPIQLCSINNLLQWCT